MTINPVVPLFVLIMVAVAVITAGVVEIRRRAPAGRNRGPIWRSAGITAAALFLVLAAARPVPDTQHLGSAGIAGADEPNIFVLLDRSPAMFDADTDGRPRMAAAQDDIAALIDRYPRARFAVIGFADRPVVDWPLSADTWSLRATIATLQPYAPVPGAVDGTNPGAAATVLRYQIISATQQYSRAQNLVFYLGAGSPEYRGEIREFDPPPGSVDGGAVLSYQSSGDDATLRGIAEQIGIRYVSGAQDAALAEALAGMPQGANPDGPVAPAGPRVEIYWALALGAALLVLVELYLVLRDLRRTSVGRADVTP